MEHVDLLEQENKKEVKKRANKIRGYLVNTGFLLGLLIGWVTRPKSILIGRMSIQDYFQHINEIFDDSVGGHFLQEVTIHVVIFIVIGSILGMAFATVVNELNKRSEPSKDNS